MKQALLLLFTLLFATSSLPNLAEAKRGAFHTHYKSWRAQMLAMRLVLPKLPLTKRKGYALKHLVGLNDALFAKLLKSGSIKQAVVVNDCLYLLAKDRSTISFSGGLVGYHDKLFFVTKKTMDWVFKLASQVRGQLPLLAVVNRTVPIGPPKIGMYTLFLETKGPVQMRVTKRSLTIKSKKNFAPRTGVMLYNTRRMRVSRTIKANDRTILVKFFRANREIKVGKK